MLPNNEFKQIKVYPNEYINNVTMNRPNSRLLANDLYIEKNALMLNKEAVVPETSSAPGSAGAVIFDDDYMYIYTGVKWVRYEVETF